ncbi:MAG: type-F conjugative transfer system pilin assembly protein TrbC [Proteobacteria bacterium]|nr:type-F conjugative transfer system pilin assembly protein TrbC [Pseudomonadota bacterium]
MLYALKTSCFFFFLSMVLNAKPDLEKAYKDGLAFANSKVEENKSIFKPRVGVCQKAAKEEDILKCLKGGKGHEFKLPENKKEEDVKTTIGDKIYVFVSFSMPKASLINLLKEAPKHNATLVLRGLKNNSFKETAKVIQDFYDQEKGEGVGFEINPELFEKHKIASVPVFLNLTNNNKLSGNVTLDFAVKKIKEEGFS